VPQLVCVDIHNCVCEVLIIAASHTGRSSQLASHSLNNFMKAESFSATTYEPFIKTITEVYPIVAERSKSPVLLLQTQKSPPDFVAYSAGVHHILEISLCVVFVVFALLVRVVL